MSSPLKGAKFSHTVYRRTDGQSTKFTVVVHRRQLTCTVCVCINEIFKNCSLYRVLGFIKRIRHRWSRSFRIFSRPRVFLEDDASPLSCVLAMPNFIDSAISLFLPLGATSDLTPLKQGSTFSMTPQCLSALLFKKWERSLCIRWAWMTYQSNVKL